MKTTLKVICGIVILNTIGGVTYYISNKIKEKKQEEKMKKEFINRTNREIEMYKSLGYDFDINLDDLKIKDDEVTVELSMNIND